jgi:aspartate aminotransferase
MGYDVTTPEATFYLVVRAPEDDDGAFSDRLAEQGVYVLPGAIFEMPGYFRLSLTANDDMVERSLGAFRRLAPRATVG